MPQAGGAGYGSGNVNPTPINTNQQTSFISRTAVRNQIVLNAEQLACINVLNNTYTMWLAENPNASAASRNERYSQYIRDYNNCIYNPTAPGAILSMSGVGGPPSKPQSILVVQNSGNNIVNPSGLTKSQCDSQYEARVAGISGLLAGNYIDKKTAEVFRDDALSDLSKCRASASGSTTGPVEISGELALKNQNIYEIVKLAYHISPVDFSKAFANHGVYIIGDSRDLPFIAKAIINGTDKTGESFKTPSGTPVKIDAFQLLKSLPISNIGVSQSNVKIV